MQKVRIKGSCGVATMQLLRHYHVELIFGIPGVHTTELYRGIALAGIRHVTARHEQSAGFMADGYARATGKAGVCCLITGPGLTNAATALAQAYSDSIPVLAITSANKTSSLGKGEGDLHELPNQQKLAEQFTAHSYSIRDVDEIPEIIETIFTNFFSERPRPMHLEIPIDLLEQEVNWQFSLRHSLNRSIYPRSSVLKWPEAQRFRRKTADLHSDEFLENHAIPHIVETLRNAKQPAMIVGGGTRHAKNEVRKLLAALPLPTVTTYSAKGVVPTDHPLCLGASLSKRVVLDYLQQCDVVLAVGTELSETDIWIRGGDIEFDGTLIRIDVDSEQIDKNANASIGIVGDSKRILEKVLRRVGQSRVSDSKSLTRRTQQVSKVLSTIHEDFSDFEVRHEHVWSIVRDCLGDSDIVTADSTQIVYSGNFCYPAMEPNTYLTSTTGFGTLGFGLPAAIGAKFGMPERSVVCVAGDGGFMFTIQELATAVEHRLPIVILLWQNYGYGEIRDNFRRNHVPLIGVDLQSPNFVDVALGFGCHASRVSSLVELKQSLHSALAADAPTLLEVSAELAID